MVFEDFSSDFPEISTADTTTAERPLHYHQEVIK